MICPGVCSEKGQRPNREDQGCTPGPTQASKKPVVIGAVAVLQETQEVC